MVIDYSERRQSLRMQSKRPQRPSVWPYALVIVAMITAAFLLGVGTGWYLFRPGGKMSTPPIPPQANKPATQQQQHQTSPAPSAAPSPQGKDKQQEPQQQPLNALPTVDKGAPVPLTFYNTLQKGNKELMGTGINQPKEGHGGATKPVSPPQPEH